MGRGGWKTKKGADLTLEEREKKRKYERKRFANWSMEQRAKHRDRATRHRRANLEKYRELSYNRSLKKLYGLSRTSYDEMLAAQNSLCAICFRVFHNRPRVDHCHVTHRVRALLCAGCNTLVGYVEKNIDVLPDVFAYIHKHK